MSDLRRNALRMRELLEHIVECEGAIAHFYCDHHGLVTIGVGYLVDEAGAANAAGEDRARRLAERPDVRFSQSSGQLVTDAEVLRDWRRVKQYGVEHPGVGAAQYGAVANLRIDSPSIRNLLDTTVRAFADELYRQRPFLMSFDERVAMAFVDVRYNPARVRLYGAET